MGLHYFDAGNGGHLKVNLRKGCATEGKMHRDRTVELKALQPGLMVFGESSER